MPAVEAILAATGGRGADSVIDAVATDASLTDALNAVRPGGTVSVVGVHDMNPFPLNALGCVIRSTTLRGTTAPVPKLDQAPRFQSAEVSFPLVRLGEAKGP